MQVKNFKAQGNMALVFIIVFIVLLFLVNFFIRATIDKTDVPVPQGFKSVEPQIIKQDTAVVTPSQPADIDHEPSIKTATPAKNTQTATPDKEKEIIHEPSIKENILLQ